VFGVMDSADSQAFFLGPNEDSMNSAPDCNMLYERNEDCIAEEVSALQNFEDEGKIPDAAEPSPQECFLAFNHELETLRKRPRSEPIPNTIPEREIFQRLSNMIRTSGLATQSKIKELKGSALLSKRSRRACLLILSHEILSSTDSVFTWTFRARAVLPDSTPISISDFAKRVFFETENNVKVGEWSASKVVGSQPVDEIVITRSSPLPSIARIHVSLDADPPIFRLHSKLASLLGLDHETMVGLVSHVMNYVSLHCLQDPDDRRFINCDAELQEILGAARIAVCHIPKLIEKHVDVCEAFVVPYELSVESGTKVYETLIETLCEPVNIPDECKPLISDEVFDAEMTEALRKVHIARTRFHFFSRLANSPVEFLTEYLQSQANDLRILQQGGGLYHASHEESSRARLWQQPWVEEAVASYVIRSFK
jgi:hypothetical protein